MKVYYILLSLFALFSPLFAMENPHKRPYLELDQEPEEMAETEQPSSKARKVSNFNILEQFSETADVCRECNKNIGKSKLLTHFKNEHADKKPFKCPTCNYTGNWWKLVRTHITNKHIYSYNPTSCWFCNLKLDGQKSFVDHFKQQHLSEKPFRCPRCEQYTANRPDTIRNHLAFCIHQAISTDNSDNNEIIPLPTPMINYISAPTPAIQHVIAHEEHVNDADQLMENQTNIGNFTILQQFLDTVDTCRECNKNIGKKELPFHFHKEHQDKMPFKCPACNYTSNQQNLAKAHITDKHIHLYKATDCWICHANLNSKKSLINHFNQQHPGEKPFRCPYCKHTTNQSSGIKIHLPTHMRKNIGQKTISTDSSHNSEIVSLPTPVANYISVPTPVWQPTEPLFNAHQCTYEKCAQIFLTEQELQEHLDTEH